MSTVKEQAGAATTWRIDPAHTHVEFAVKHMMIATVKGRFAEVSGTVKLSGDDQRPLSAEIEIEAASLDTREPDRDTHLRSADFLEVETFPKITFRSTEVEAVDDTHLRLTGDLTIHGITREVTLDGTDEGRGKDPWGGERAGFSAVTKVDRRDFDLTWNQALETGGILVGNEVRISLEVEAVKVTE